MCFYKSAHLSKKRDLSEFRRSFCREKRSHGSISELERGKPSSPRNCWVHLCSQRRRVCDREARVFLRRWPCTDAQINRPQTGESGGTAGLPRGGVSAAGTTSRALSWSLNSLNSQLTYLAFYRLFYSKINLTSRPEYYFVFVAFLLFYLCVLH